MASRYPARPGFGYPKPSQRHEDDGQGDELDEGTDRRQQRPARKPRHKSTRGKKWKVDVSGLTPSRTWHQIRELCFERAGQRCERCGKPRSQAYRFDPHHRKLVSRGGRDELSNLAALCDECHRWCHDHNDAAELAGWIVPSWADPHVRAFTLHDGRMVLCDDDGSYSWEGRP
jgi:hypothetical protein